MTSIQTMDNRILSAIQDKLQCTMLDEAMPMITRLGNKGFVWVLVAFFFFTLPNYRRNGAAVILALALSGGVGCLCIKSTVRRVRPCDANPDFPLLIPRPTDPSFPSGHTMSSFAAALVIFWTMPLLGVAAFVLAALISFSRLYLHVHYPSDVLGGIVLGIAAARFVALLLYKA